ncbi:putative transposase [Cupriavidus basilensis OR16]|uniref:Putative transposase n=1 Tax=Cupriavidus basilensis OR16 TaxID=1127483 RepID=H1S809_9BURK|nr:putative transposase [Cupriavidus basilensis OR16]
MLEFLLKKRLIRGDTGYLRKKYIHSDLHHFYSSWLNQVELWFAKIERAVIARGVFTSVPDLNRKLMRYIRKYNEQPKSVKWKYFDPTRRITPDSIVTVH